MERHIVNPVLKEMVTFVKTAAETAGETTELEIMLMPGGGNPLHYHTSYKEIFTAVEGELGIELAHRRKITLKPGESFVVDVGVVHRFFNPGNKQIKFRNEVYPGHAGFENTLRILSGLAADGLYNRKDVPRNLTHLAVCAIMSDMRLPGLMSLTTPLLKWLTAKAKRKGITQQLLDRYCK